MPREPPLLAPALLYYAHHIYAYNAYEFSSFPDAQLLLLNSVTSFSFVLELLMLLAIKSDEGVIKIYLHTMCNQFRFGLKFHVANLSQIANQFMNVLYQN